MVIAVDDFDRCLECGAAAPRDGRRICASCAVTWVFVPRDEPAESLRKSRSTNPAVARVVVTRDRKRLDWE